MTLKYNPTSIEQFFGPMQRSSHDPEHFGHIIEYDYIGPILRYTLMLLPDKHAACISGNDHRPFAFDSLYEIYIPCSEIVDGLDIYQTGQIYLNFFFGNSKQPVNCRMSIMKRSDGELVICTGSPYPQGHPFYYSADSDE